MPRDGEAFRPGGDLVTARGRVLRPLGEADLDDLVSATNHSGVTSAISFMRDPFTRSDAEALLAQQEGGRDVFLAIREGATLVGVVGCHLVAEGDPATLAIEIGYWITPSRWGGGVAQDAAARALAWIRTNRPGSLVFAECRPDNAASRRVLERLGFRPTGQGGAREGRERLVWQPRP